MLMMTSIASAEWVGAYIAQSTSVYQMPTTKSANLNVSAGFPVVVTAVNGGWAQIKNAAGITAYCPLNMLNLANRVKGYVSRETKIYQYASTSSTAAGPLAVNTEVYVIGMDGSFFRVQNGDGSIIGYLPMSAVSNAPVQTQPEAQQDWRDYVQNLDWYKNGKNILRKGEYGMIYDIASGKTIKIYRMGGSDHADVEPATLEDTKTLYNIVGGEYSWDSRAVILITSRGAVAAAINTMPHGDQTIYDNNYEGQFCLHMLNSRTHGSDAVNQEHQKAINAAYKWAHS